MPAVRPWFPVFAFILVASCGQQACPSIAGGSCDPRNFDCPPGYTCSLAEVCTRTCAETAECWVKVEDGCRFDQYLPGQLQPDGGPFMESSEDGFCPETKLMECIEGYCQRFSCADGGCDYDVYGPGTKGTQTQGPEE